MSLSDHPALARSGTVYSPSGSYSLEGLERRRPAYWSDEDEAEYLDRVREKAAAMAGEMLDAARREAEDVRQAAREEGYSRGLAAAEEELAAFRSGMADTVAGVLGAIEGQCSTIFRQWREDLVGITRLAVAKGVGMALSEDRSLLLETLLTRAVEVLEQRRELLIRVHPEDEAALEDILRPTREKYPDVAVWKVRADASLRPGSIVVESASSLAASRAESRLAAVEQVLEHLSLPELP